MKMASQPSPLNSATSQHTTSPGYYNRTTIVKERNYKENVYLNSLSFQCSSHFSFRKTTNTTNTTRFGT